MATETLTTNANSMIGFWSNPDNTQVEDANFATAGGTDFDFLQCHMPQGNISNVASFDSVHFRVIGYNSPASTNIFAKVSKNGGANFCSGHDLEGAGAFSSSFGVDGDSGWILCSHSEAPASEAEWEATAGQIRVRIDRGLTLSNAGIDFVQIRATYTTGTVPAAPTDPTITADGVGDLTVSSNSPDDGGGTLDDVEHQISLSPTFASGNITWTKGSAPTDPQTHQFTGLANGAGPYYARARYHNILGWGAYNASPYNTATVWDVPSNADPLSATTPLGSSIRTTKATVNPDDGGEPIDTWSVWRSATSDGTYTKVSGDIAIATTFYEDQTVYGGETWYYKTKYKNLVGDGAISTNSVNTTANMVVGPTSLSDARIKRAAFDEQARLSDSRIKRVGFDEQTRISDARIAVRTEVSPPVLSDARVKNTMTTLNPLSDAIIKQPAFNEMLRISGARIGLRIDLAQLSDARVKKSTGLSRTSDARIWDADLTDKLSDARIKVPKYGHLLVTSDAIIGKVFEVSKLSDSKIVVRSVLDNFSDSRIKRQGFADVFRLSEARIKNSMETPVLSDSRIVKAFEVPVLSDAVIGKVFLIQNTSDAKIIHRPELQRLSAARIKKLDFEFTKLSDATIIHRYNILNLSDARIGIVGNTITKGSISRMKRRFPLFYLSDSKIKNIYEINRISNSRLKNTTEFGLNSNSIIQIQDNELTVTSDAKVYKVFSMTKTSDARIRSIRGKILVEFVKVRVV